MAEKRIDIIIGAKNRAGKVLRNLTARMKQFGKAAAKVGAGAVVTAAAVLGKMATQGFRATASIAKLDDQTGETAEQISALRFAANKFGIDTEDVQGAIEELNIRLGETIRDGMGPAAEAFKTLGLDAERLAELPVSERIGKIGDALNNVSKSKRPFLADEIFGGDAFKVIQLINKGSEGLRELRKQADQVGAIVSGRGAEKVQDAARAIREMKASFGGLGRQIAIAVSPAVEATANFISTKVIPAAVRMGEIMSRVFSNVADFVTNTLIPVFVSVTTPIRKAAVIAWQAITSAFSAIMAAIQPVIEIVQTAWNAFTSILPSISEVRAAFENLGLSALVVFRKAQVKANEFKDVLSALVRFVAGNATVAAGNAVKVVTTAFSNVVTMGENFVNNFGEISNSVFEAFKAIVTRIPDLFKAAFSDIGNLGKSFLSALTSGEFGKIASGKVFSGFESSAAKVATNAGKEAGKNLNDALTATTKGTTPISDLDFAGFRDFQVQTSDATREAREKLQLEEQRLARNIEQSLERQRRERTAGAGGEDGGAQQTGSRAAPPGGQPPVGQRPPGAPAQNVQATRPTLVTNRFTTGVESARSQNQTAKKQLDEQKKQTRLFEEQRQLLDEMIERLSGGNPQVGGIIGGGSGT